MNCQQINKHIFDYCENNLSPDISTIIAQHIESCTDCMANMALTNLENSVLDNLPSPQPPVDFTAEVMQKAFVTRPLTQSNKFFNKKNLLLALPISALLLIFLTLNYNGISQLNNAPTKVSENDTIHNIGLIPPKPQKENSRIFYADTETKEQSKQIAAIPQDTQTNMDNEIVSDDLSLGPDNIIQNKVFESPSRKARITKPAILEEEELIIGNMPDNYTLYKIDKISENEISYFYEDLTAPSTMDVTVQILSNIAKTEESIVASEFSAFGESLAREQAQDPINQYNWKVIEDSNIYIISIQSDLPVEEIVYLSSVITITK